FTPATGPRLLVAEGLQRLPIHSAIAESLKEVVRRLGISSAHITFVTDEEIGVFEMDGYMHRTDQQFHLINDGYANHEDFL
ncbi:peptidogalycan biosysnthesis protein, partial [Rhizobium leguminosarum]|uniref:peptidogalycan biosysnthesis protein n=1 Tax=Rhizobium leguminosarum TaxID=384 RepID=UPI003F9C96E3